MFAVEIMKMLLTNHSVLRLKEKQEEHRSDEPLKMEEIFGTISKSDS